MGAHPSVTGLVVVDVSGSEAVRVWNEENPGQPVEVGQAVLEVNGVTRFCSDMLKEFEGKQVELVLTRELTEKQSGVLRASLKKHRTCTVAENLEVVSSSSEPCAICHEEGGEEEAKLPCGHQFHKACLKRWLIMGKPRCPLCNFTIQP